MNDCITILQEGKILETAVWDGDLANEQIGEAIRHFQKSHPHADVLIERIEDEELARRIGELSHLLGVRDSKK